ncbi:MAG: isoaspartyl peptidase/L-asparaginase [Flavobacteriaceae bacterium]|nr:isoaspartyl peptidase/L-asparaginase [Flavobacteriaceae bacterium]
MKNLILSLFLGLSFTLFSQDNPIAIVIHGGAGTILKKNMTPEMEAAYQTKLQEAVEAGYAVLQQGGSSVEAVEKTIRILEDSPLFNAGKGAVFTHEGKNEMDAAIMEGKNLNAGAISGVTTVKNPISLAIQVMNNSPHVMLSGKGAEQFAREKNIELVDPDYFYTESRMKALERAKEKEEDEGFWQNTDYKFGTVGCVAVDKNGNIAAGTSTGGMTNKRWNRIGDAPIIGAGTYANNLSCGVSGTGWGEYFIRATVAHDIAALMEYKGLSVQEASHEVIYNKMAKLGGDGGVIALDRQGNIAMEFNTAGMYRASIDANGKRTVAIYKE